MNWEFKNADIFKSGLYDLKGSLMVDISEKPDIIRMAKASGRIYLREETVEEIRERRIKKGDVFEVTRAAAALAVKNTPRVIPLCHPIPISNVSIDFNLGRNFVEIFVEVKARAPTGVEMEALHGVLVSLLNVWDMVKYLEKDEGGNYPYTKIGDVKVLKKVKIGDGS